MSSINTLLHAFNRGEISQSALSRVDVDRVRLSAEQQVNWMPRKIGAMSVRPGLGYLGSTKSDAKAQLIPFVSSLDNKAVLEFTNSVLRVWLPGSPDSLLTRVVIANTTISQPGFDGTGSWSPTSSGGTATINNANNSELRMSATSLGGEGKCTQTVSVPGGAGTDRNKEHALRIVVTRGPVQFKLGSTPEGDEYIKETTLQTGTHSLAFTPTGDFIIQFKTTLLRECRIASCSLENSNSVVTTVELPSPYLAANLDYIRWAQSADVLFLACDGFQQRKIERRSQRSWSIVKYAPVDGPLMSIPTANVAFTPSGTTGNITVTSDKPFFRLGHTGAVFRVFQTTEQIDTTISAQNTFSDPIRISGVKNAQPPKIFQVHVQSNLANDSAGTGETGDRLNSGFGSLEVRRPSKSSSLEAESARASNTRGGKGASKEGPRATSTRKFTFGATANNGFNGWVSLQRSFDGEDVGYETVFTNQKSIQTRTIIDEFDNSVVWYRAGVETSKFGSTGGTPAQSVTFRIKYPHGGHSGIFRVTSWTDSTHVEAEVLSPLSSKTATREWLEGAWSDRQGWPSSVGFYGGRLWWFGNDTAWGSVSDAYESYDYDLEGDAAPIIRSIGEGPVQAINGMIPLKRPILLGSVSEMAIRSNAFDEPLTPTSFNINQVSTQGSTQAQAVKLDGRGIFIHRSKRRIYQILYQGDQQDYASVDLTALHPDLGSADFTKLAVQRQPETMLHVVRADGTACVLLLEPSEEVVAWWRIVTDGSIENVCVLPGTPEDQVYYVVRRSINGVTKRYLERFARLDECLGGSGTNNKIADAFIVTPVQASSTTVMGLSHLEAKTVVVWANGKDLGTKTVSSGQITGLSEAVTSAMVGLAYDATYKSTKLAYAAQKGTALLQKKRIPRIGLILLNTHYQAIRYGDNFTDMTAMPKVENGTSVPADTVHVTYDEQMFPLDGSWDTDARLCLKVTAPKPATVCAAVIGLETRDS